MGIFFREKFIWLCFVLGVMGFVFTSEQAFSQSGPGLHLPVDPYRIDYKEVYGNMHYDQPLRPQVHYTPITGQIADPTGLILYKGTYHLFYMYDEWSKKRGDNKNWGHAVSNDCIFWSQEPQITNTIIDNAPGSGSGIVDWNNTLKLQTGIEKTLVVFYTDYGRGPSLAFSKDAGKTWIRHKDNPILPGKSGLRDPNVFWFGPDQSWRMVIYEEEGFSFYKSDNLLRWKFLSRLDGFFECPDFIHMPADNLKERSRWVLLDGNGSYLVGDFDGEKFVPEGKRHFLGQDSSSNRTPHAFTKDIYATQTWKRSYEGDGPFYQLAFMRMGEAPVHERTWSQQMIFPVELTLQTINNELQLCRNPIDGIKQLRFDPVVWKNREVHPGENLLKNLHADVFELMLEMDVSDAGEIELDIRGAKLTYNVIKQEICFLNTHTAVAAENHRIKLRLIVDRNSVEVFVNKGETTITRLFYPENSNKNLGLTARGGPVSLVNAAFYKLQSIWLKREQELGYNR